MNTVNSDPMKTVSEEKLDTYKELLTKISEQSALLNIMSDFCSVKTVAAAV